MENAEEILQCLDEFTKLRPKEIPPELEYYLSFVARTGDPVYQWPLIKCLFREKLISVITDFYEACPSIEIPPCPNVDLFNYEAMKGFILEKLDTFAAAPFTVQRICELLTSPRKEYNRIDKYMRALEKNILVVSTREPGNRKTENGESIVNGLESEHDHHDDQEINSISSEINVEVDLDETKTVWHKNCTVSNIITTTTSNTAAAETVEIQESYISESKCAAPTTNVNVNINVAADSSVITTRQLNYIAYTNAMIVEQQPITTTTTTTSTSVLSNEDQSEQLKQNSDNSSNSETVFNLNRAQVSEKEDEHIYVTEAETIGGTSAEMPEITTTVAATEESSSSSSSSSCVVEDMDTTQIISEPITPPEIHDTSLLQAETKTEIQTDDVQEEEVEVSSTMKQLQESNLHLQQEAKAQETQEEKEEETISSSTSSSSSNLCLSSSQNIDTILKETQPQPIVDTSTLSTINEVENTSSEDNVDKMDEVDAVEVTASNQLEVEEEEVEVRPEVIIGPEDMQVEDISPEPEISTTPTVVTEIVKKPEETEVEIEAEKEENNVKSVKSEEVKVTESNN